MSAAGLVPMLALAEAAGLARLAQQQLSLPTDKGANAGLKVASLVGGMVAGADSIDDMRLLRHGGMGRVFTGRYAPSTVGSFLRSFGDGEADRAGEGRDRGDQRIAVPARIATSARRLMLHLPINWPWQQAWTAWFNRVCGLPVASAT